MRLATLVAASCRSHIPHKLLPNPKLRRLYRFHIDQRDSGIWLRSEGRGVDISGGPDGGMKLRGAKRRAGNTIITVVMSLHEDSMRSEATSIKDILLNRRRFAPPLLATLVSGHHIEYWQHEHLGPHRPRRSVDGSHAPLPLRRPYHALRPEGCRGHHRRGPPPGEML